MGRKEGAKIESSSELKRVIVDALDNMKGQDIAVFDVRHLTSVTDHMVIATGRSDRHVRSLANAVLERCRAHGSQPAGIEGEAGGEWVLVDMMDVVVHVMQTKARDFYNLEKLWSLDPPDRATTV